MSSFGVGGSRGVGFFVWCLGGFKWCLYLFGWVGCYCVEMVKWMYGELRFEVVVGFFGFVVFYCCCLS